MTTLEIIEAYKFVKIESGTFMIGSPESEKYRYSDEVQHEVTISRPFEIQTTQVTQDFWESIMGNNPSQFKGPLRPVECVSWNDAQVFIARLNEQIEKYLYRLPTEAEWEIACRARSKEPYWARPELISWYSDNSESQTHAVATKEPNAWGLYDMHGNVWEWCQDWYSEYSKEPVLDPIGPSSGSNRVIRGGGWYNNAKNLRSARRSNDGPANTYDVLGFRLARTLRSELLPLDPLPACDSRRTELLLISQIREKLDALEFVLKENK